MLAFSLTVENAQLFYEVCRELKAETEAERVAILQAMAKLGKVKNIVQSKLSKEEYIKHLSKHFTCAIVKKAPDNAQQEGI